MHCDILTHGHIEGPESVAVERDYRKSFVGNRVAAGHEQMLQSVEERKGPRHALVTDLGTVAERQAGEAAAVIGYGHQAVVTDLGQHRKRETL